MRVKSKMAISATFEPLNDRSMSHHIVVHWDSHLGGRSDLKVAMRGAGGHPSLEVKCASLNFGTALLHCDNSKTLRIFNNGSAEAMAQIDMPAGVITCRPDSPIFVPPFGHRDVTIIYRPTNVEDLDGVLVVKSIESMGTGEAGRRTT